MRRYIDPLTRPRVDDATAELAAQDGHSDQIVVPFARDLIDARAQRDALRLALADALDGMEDMICYVTPYFIEKWGHEGYIARAREALEAVEGVM